MTSKEPLQPKLFYISVLVFVDVKCMESDFRISSEALFLSLIFNGNIDYSCIYG